MKRSRKTGNNFGSHWDSKPQALSLVLNARLQQTKEEITVNELTNRSSHIIHNPQSRGGQNPKDWTIDFYIMDLLPTLPKTRKLHKERLNQGSQVVRKPQSVSEEAVEEKSHS